MHIPEQALDELKEIYLREHGISIGDKEAYELGIKLLVLMGLIHKHKTKKEKKNETEKNDKQ